MPNSTTKNPLPHQNDVENGGEGATASALGTSNRVVMPTQRHHSNKRKTKAPISDKPVKQPRVLPLRKRTNDAETKPRQTPIPLLKRLMKYCQRHRQDLLPALVQTLANHECEKDERNFVSLVIRRLGATWGAPTMAQVYRAASRMPFHGMDGNEEISQSAPAKTRGKKSAPVYIDLTRDDEDDEDERAEPKGVDVSRATETIGLKAENGSSNRAKDVSDKQTPLSLQHETVAATNATPALVGEKPKGTPTQTGTVPDEIELAIAFGFDLARRLSISGTNTNSSSTWEFAAKSIRCMSQRDRERVWKRLSMHKPAKQNASPPGALKFGKGDTRK